MENNLRKEVITSLKVSKLFGRFDHDLTFPITSNISIITAPNGYGKTVLLRIINSIFNGNVQFFWKINFEKIMIGFSSDRAISIIKTINNDANNDKNDEYIVEFKCHGFGSDMEVYSPPVGFSSSIMRELENYFPVERIGRDTWRDYSSERELSTHEILMVYSERLPERLRDHIKIPQWFQAVISSVSTRLVETQRLLDLKESQERRSRHPRHTAPSSAVDNDASDLAKRIGRLLQDYANESQNLDQTFPKRILDSGVGEASSVQELLANLQQLAQKCDELRSVGLLGSTMIAPILTHQIPEQETIRRILEIYVKDTRDKLSILDETYEKIRLFKQILNERFSFKTIEIDSSIGIRAIDQFDNQPIPLAELSSGEQHELVLIYELLFKVEEGTIILIDEPELSLHVTWQRNFIEDLQKIQTLKKLRVIIATHSPQIIHDKWDLVQELKA